MGGAARPASFCRKGKEPRNFETGLQLSAGAAPAEFGSAHKQTQPITITRQAPRPKSTTAHITLSVFYASVFCGSE